MDPPPTENEKEMMQKPRPSTMSQQNQAGSFKYMKHFSASDNDECAHNGMQQPAPKKERTSTVKRPIPPREVPTQAEASHKVFEPHAHDVLCGRGGFANKHPGNIIFRRLVAANTERYRSCMVDHKLLLSRSIVEVIRNQTPPGRFLMRLQESNVWMHVGDCKALQKTSQALREGSAADQSR